MAKAVSRLGRGLGSLIAGGTSSAEEPSTPVSSSLATQVESGPIPSDSSESGGKKILVSEDSTEGLLELSTEVLIPNPYQPRKIIDPNAISELAASIESEGLLQPVVVRKAGEDYELVAGERRWRAHQYLGRKKILARVLSASDISSALLSLIENLQREGLNPIEEAMGYQSLVNEFNLTQAKVAEQVGKSRAHVANLLRLLQLDDELKSLLTSQKLSLGHAKVLLGLEDTQQRNALGKKVVEQGLTVRQCEQAVDAIRNPIQPTKRHFVSSTAQFSQYAKIAQSSLKRPVAINSDPTGKGKVSFSFSDESDLKVLLENIGIRIS